MKRDWWNKEFRTLVTFGESITAGGWSSCRERSWAAQLTRMINDIQAAPVQLVNVGIGANLISPRSPNYAYSSHPSAMERLDEHVLHNAANGAPIRPDLLIISYSLCDAMAGTPVDQFICDLTTIIERVRAATQPLIVLTGPYFVTDYTVGSPHFGNNTPERTQEFNTSVRNLAARMDCLFADLLFAYDNAPWLVHRDSVHANDLGHRVVANRIFETLAKNCSGLSLRTKALEKQILPWRDESTLQK